MSQVVLPQQVLAVVIAIRSSHYAMDVLLGRLRGVRSKLPQVGGLLVIKFGSANRGGKNFDIYQFLRPGCR